MVAALQLWHLMHKTQPYNRAVFFCFFRLIFLGKKNVRKVWFFVKIWAY